MESGKSILIVDDEANLRSTLTLILQRAGFYTRSAANGEEALKCLRKDSYDLIFLDLKMPGMDGLQVLSEIRLMNSSLPVLILTANGTLDSAIDALRAGANGYLLKPVEPEEIIARVNQVFFEKSQDERRRQILTEIKGIVAELNELEI